MKNSFRPGAGPESFGGGPVEMFLCFFMRYGTFTYAIKVKNRFYGIRENLSTYPENS
jgi:hypothetical protein